jgi:hypothetical protein
MRPAWTKLFGVIPVAPNTLSVQIADGGAEHNLVLKGRGAWMEAIQDAKGSG